MATDTMNLGNRELIDNDSETAAAATTQGPALIRIATDSGELCLLPSEQVLLTHASVNTRKTNELRSAIPYALEDQLSEPVEGLHFAWAAEQDGQRPVAVVARATMLQLADAGLPATLLPDCLVLPWQPGHWSIVVHHQRAIIRHGRYQGFACPLDRLSDHLGLLARETLPESVDVWLPEEHAPIDWPTGVEPRVHTGPAADGAGLEAWFRQHAEPCPDLNLCTGEFAPDSGSGTDWRLWLLPLVLLLAIPVTDIWMGQQRLQDLQQRNDSLQQETEALVREAFPDISRVVNARVQMAQRLQGLRERATAGPGAGFMDLFPQVMAVLQDDVESQLQGVTWRNRQLELQLLASDISPFEQAKQRLREAGLELNILNVNRQEEGVALRLLVREIQP